MLGKHQHSEYACFCAHMSCGGGGLTRMMSCSEAQMCSMQKSVGVQPRNLELGCVKQSSISMVRAGLVRTVEPDCCPERSFCPSSQTCTETWLKSCWLIRPLSYDGSVPSPTRWVTCVDPLWHHMLGCLEVARQHFLDERKAVQQKHEEWVSGDASFICTYCQPQVTSQEACTKQSAVILHILCISG